MNAVSFTVYGVPIPKGSTKAFMRPGMKHPVITHDNARTKPWQEAIVSAAIEARGVGEPIAGPVEVRIVFYLLRPTSAPKRVTRPLKKPDLDKLVRAVKDGMTRAGIYHDDAQVVRIVADKRFAAGEEDVLGAAGVPRAAVYVIQR